MKQIKKVKVAILGKINPNNAVRHEKSEFEVHLQNQINVPLVYSADNIFPFDKIPKSDHIGRAHNFVIEKDALYADFIIKEPDLFEERSITEGPYSPRITTEYEVDNMVKIINVYLLPIEQDVDANDWTGVMVGTLEPYPTETTETTAQKPKDKFKKD